MFSSFDDTEKMFLNRMNCFKEIESNTVDADNTEYEHVFKYKRYNGNAKVYTLTKSEWEAFCMLLLFIYYKLIVVYIFSLLLSDY